MPQLCANDPPLLGFVVPKGSFRYFFRNVGRKAFFVHNTHLCSCILAYVSMEGSYVWLAHQYSQTDFVLLGYYGDQVQRDIVRDAQDDEHAPTQLSVLGSSRYHPEHQATVRLRHLRCNAV